MEWTIRRTDTFIESLSKVKGNKEVIIELGKNFNPETGPPQYRRLAFSALHGKKATRIAKRYRPIFLPDERERTVYLIAIDHRQHVYRLR